TPANSASVFPEPDSRPSLPTLDSAATSAIAFHAAADNLRLVLARSTPRRRRLVAREGLEPSKPLGRQIYSLLRLTASLPRQLSVLECVRRSYRAGRAASGVSGPELRRDGAGEGI